MKKFLGLVLMVLGLTALSAIAMADPVATETYVSGLSAATQTYVATAVQTAQAQQTTNAQATMSCSPTFTPTFTITNTPNATTTWITQATQTATSIYGTARRTATAVAATSTAVVVQATQAAIALKTAGVSAQGTATQQAINSTATKSTYLTYTPTLTPTPYSYVSALGRANAAVNANNLPLAVANYKLAATYAYNAGYYTQQALAVFSQTDCYVNTFKSATKFSKVIDTISFMQPTPAAKAIATFKPTVVAGVSSYLAPALTAVPSCTPVISYSVIKNKVSNDVSYIRAVQTWVASN
jgi:hypothetical protein